jgi:glycosyltransferase involved in cell wall biosynthesis
MSRILFISHIFPPAIDGGSRVIYKLGQYFESQRHQTLYLSSNCFSTDDFVKSNCLISEKLTSNQLKLPVYHYFRRPLKLLEIICIKFLFINPKSYFINLIKVFQKGPIFKFVPFIKATIKIIKFKPDYIIAGPLPTTIVLYAHLIRYLSTNLFHYSTKLLINASFHPTDSDFQQIPLIKSLQQADYIWTLTQFETDYFIKKFNINPNKIILAGNGVETNLLKNNKIIPCHVKDGVRERFDILFIGSLSAHKRVDLLIKAFTSLISNNLIDYSSTQLIIAGQKTLYYPNIQSLIKKLPSNIKTKIKFIFNFSDNKLTNIIDNCDFLVLPSVQESFGLVLIESWARSKPVIVSNIDSLSEIVSNCSGGLIFKKDNQSDLEKNILKLINSPKLCHQLGQNGLIYVKNNYTWEKVGQKIKQKLFLSV